MDLSDFRKQYTKGRLITSEVPPNPFILFKNWFEEVQSKGKEQETNAMTLSTQQPDGGVASRVVLLKEVSDEGFVFYTNYNSTKGQSIEHNNQVCISFFGRAWNDRSLFREQRQNYHQRHLTNTFNPVQGVAKWELMYRIRVRLLKTVLL